MPKLEIYCSGRKICKTNANLGDTLLQAICDAGVYLDAPCGGDGRCGKCLVRSTLDGDEVLACRTFVDGDMRVYLPDEGQMMIAGDFGIATSQVLPFPPHTTSPSPSPSGTSKDPIICQCKKSGDNASDSLGVAVDVGTTTVVACLVDCGSGRPIATASGVNAQRIYGADVISRINYCSAHGHEKLTALIRAQIETLIRKLLLETFRAHEESEENIESVTNNNSPKLPDNASLRRQQPQVKHVIIAGNTIMQHLVHDHSPVGMGVIPFAPISLFGTEAKAWDGLLLSPDAKVYYTPAIAAYIGGDITAGLLAVEHELDLLSIEPKAKKTTLFLDIGTNGELVLKLNDKYYCCATAAGPAFEGAQIEMGMAATRGAISHVAWDEEEKCLKLKVIGESTPIGICGSGLLDILAHLVENGKQADSSGVEPMLPLVDETGRLVGDVSSPDRFYLTDSVYITSQDVRKLQLAKAAIAAGIQTLLNYAAITDKQIDSLILAGGFGNYLDKNSAAIIGLFPQSLLTRTKAMGNTALSGAIRALSDEKAQAKLESIRESMEYIELSTNKKFNEEFVEQMSF